MRPLAIVAAVNGGYHMPQGTSRVPISPLEIAEEAARCREAGAAVVHFHARDEDGVTTGDPAVFQQTIRLIRERSDILVQTTNGIGARKNKVTGEIARPPLSERLKLLMLDPAPDLYGAATGSTDYIHPWGGQPNESPFVNNLEWMKTSIRHAHERRSTIEFEIVHIPALYRLRSAARRGRAVRPGGGLPVDVSRRGNRQLAGDRARADECDRGGQAGLPKGQMGRVRLWPAPVSHVGGGLAAGCDTLRIGMEDNLLMPNGDYAENNAQLIAEAVKLAAFFNRRPATPQETREILRLDRAGPVGVTA